MLDLHHLSFEKQERKMAQTWTRHTIPDDVFKKIKLRRLAKKPNVDIISSTAIIKDGGIMTKYPGILATGMRKDNAAVFIPMSVFNAPEINWVSRDTAEKKKKLLIFPRACETWDNPHKARKDKIKTVPPANLPSLSSTEEEETGDSEASSMYGSSGDIDIAIDGSPPGSLSPEELDQLMQSLGENLQNVGQSYDTVDIGQQTLSGVPSDIVSAAAERANIHQKNRKRKLN